MIRETTGEVREARGGAVRAAWMGSPWARRGGVALAAEVFLAFCGAFGSGTTALPRRMVFWLLAMGLGTAVAFGLRRRLDPRDRRLSLRDGLVLVAGISVPTILGIWPLAGWLLNGGLRLADLPGFVAPVVGVTAAMTALNVLAERRPPMTHAAPAAMAAPPRARFVDRLPAGLRGADVFAVSAEDHYLRLHTSLGSDLILMRLGDAVAELEGIEGAQTHRSWWVARDAVGGVRRADGRATLLLPGGVQAPVSRRYARALREAGWF